MNPSKFILVFETIIIIFLHFGHANESSERICIDGPIVSFNEENCSNRNSIQNVKLQSGKKSLGKYLNGLEKFFLQDVGSLKDRRCLLISNYKNNTSSAKLMSITAPFKNNVQFGKTAFEYEDGHLMSFDQIENGQFCKALTILPKTHEIGHYSYYTIINHMTNEKFYSKDLRTVVQCEQFGKIYGISCTEGKIIMVNGFPQLDESSMEREEVFDVYLPEEDKRSGVHVNGRERYSSLLDLCSSHQHVTAWLKMIEKDHWIMLDNSQIIESSIGLVGDKIIIDLHESRVPRVFQPNFVDINHNGNSIFKGRVHFDTKSGLATINVQHLKPSLDALFESPSAKKIPFQFEFLQFSQQEGKIIHLKTCFHNWILIFTLLTGSPMMSKMTNMIVIGHICKNGFICGFVKKFGVRARDESAYPCNKINVHQMSYFGFHDGLSGMIKVSQSNLYFYISLPPFQFSNTSETS